MDNKKKLFGVFCDVLGVDKVDDDTTRDDISSWNSLQSINLVMALEEEFNLELTPEEAGDILSVSLAIEVLKEKGIDFG